MFLLNVEFSKRVRFLFSSVTFRLSAFPFPRFQSPQCWPGRTEYRKLPAFIPNIQNVVTNSSCWQCLSTLLFRYFISSYYSIHAVEIFHCTIRFINEIRKEIPYETFSISFHFHKILHENTFALTPPCFISLSRAVATHRSYCFCQCSSFIVNGITDI